MRSRSGIIGWYLWGAAVSGIIIYFSNGVNQQYADMWDIVHRDHIQMQRLHVVSVKNTWDSQHREFQRYYLADDTGVTVTSEDPGNLSGVHVNSVLWGYRINNSRWLFPEVDKPVPKWVVVAGLSFVWIVVLLITLLRIRRSRE